MYTIGRILSICWHKDGQILVAGGSDGTIRVYEVATGKCNRYLVFQEIIFGFNLCSIRGTAFSFPFWPGHARLRITMDNFSQRNTLVWALAITR